MVVLHITLGIARTVPYADAAGDSLASAPRGAKSGIREDESVKPPWVVRVVGDWRVTCDVGRVVHAPLHEVLVVVEDLVGVMVRDACRERHREPSPGLPVLAPRLNLPSLHAGFRKSLRSYR
jgi:hypothetical protein